MLVLYFFSWITVVTCFHWDILVPAYNHWACACWCIKVDYTFSATELLSRAIDQAVSRRFSTAAARVQAPIRSCGICGEQSDTGTGFLRVLRFPLPILIPPIAPQLSFIIWGWYNKPNSGRSTKWTQSHPMRKIKYWIIIIIMYLFYFLAC
jgi:hypothetical protein